MPTPDAPLIAITAADPKLTDDPALTARKIELYVEAIRHHGGKPELLHVSTPAAGRERLLAAMDGLLLAGGPDVDPALYGEPVAETGAIDPARDELEMAALRAAEKRAIPVLGICRGMQVINVFAGGTLLRDVPSHAGTPYGHGEAETHDLDIEPASKLGRAIAAAAPEGMAAGDPSDPLLELQVNTFHHQAVDEDGLAPGLRPVAWAPSESGRLVEGLESRDGRWLVGVQCHPERLESTPEEFDGLWDDFVRAARAGRK
jgi:putative glutamine amidotransferase